MRISIDSVEYESILQKYEKKKLFVLFLPRMDDNLVYAFSNLVFDAQPNNKKPLHNSNISMN